MTDQNLCTIRDLARENRDLRACLEIAEAALARANLCSHGAPQAACRDHHAAATDDTPGGDK